MEKLLIKLNKLSNENLIDDGIDYLFDAIENKLIEGNYSAVDKMFSNPETANLDNNFRVGLLTITLPWKSNLPRRIMFYEKVKESLLADIKKEDVRIIIEGLK